MKKNKKKNDYRNLIIFQSGEKIDMGRYVYLSPKDGKLYLTSPKMLGFKVKNKERK